MATRFEKSGELLFCYGSLERPAPPKRKNLLQSRVVIMVAVVGFAVGIFYLTPHEVAWAAVTHSVKALIAAVW